jgi:trk system potassium uptake protein TrkH
MITDFRPILFILGLFLCVLAASMAIPMMADLWAGSEHWKNFFVCAVLTGFFGGSLVLSTGGQSFELSVRQVFILTVFVWVAICIFSALPFKLSDLQMDSEDAFFEAVSGLTTTGATVILNLDEAPIGILLWRSLLQWLGGIGIIIMAISILPFLKVGGMQIFKSESSSSDSERAVPRAAQLSYSLLIIYLSLSLICASCYMFAGMNAFDAFNHAMTTIATGGFSTRDASIGHYNNFTIELVAIVFMVLSGMPFVLFLKTLRGKKRALLDDTQVRTYLAALLISILILWLCLALWLDMPLILGLKDSMFTVISVMTGTGYYTANYAIWGGFADALLLFLMVVGGCAGSTTCGIKIFRFQVLYEAAKSQMRKLIYPNGVFFPQYNRRALSHDAVISVMSFMFAFAVLYVMGVAILSFIGLDITTSLSAVAATLSNSGPGLGPIIGPSGSYLHLPESAKWVLSILMIVGRLDIFTVLVLLTPHFWRS